MERVFVVWDFTIDVLKSTLEALSKRPPEPFQIEVPGLEPAAGSIYDNVVRGVTEADRVLVVTDRPNANVAFETGLALGLGKPTLLAFHGAELPAWSATRPLRNYLLTRFDTVSELREVLMSEGSWLRPERAPALPADGCCLHLCPGRGEGDSLREEQVAQVKTWRSLPNDPFDLSDLNARFADTARLVWTIASYAEGSDIRDGAENAANAIIAGWFRTRCLEQPEDTADRRFWVLRSKPSRRVVDVERFEEEFSGLGRYASLLHDIEQRWAARAPARRADIVAGVERSLDRLEGELAGRSDLRLLADQVRRAFSGAREKICRVGYYKEVHDALHEIQLLCYTPLLYNGCDAANQINVPILLAARSELETQVSSLKSISPAAQVSERKTRWAIERIERTVDALSEAIGKSDPNSLRRALNELGRVMNHVPGTIDNLLATAADDLGEHLPKALESLQEALADQELDAAIWQSIQVWIEDLGALQREHSTLVARHGRWEGVETRLKMIDSMLEDALGKTITREDLEELRGEWPFLRLEADELARAGSDPLRESLTRESERVDHALGLGDLYGSYYGYFGFRNVIAKIFFRVDSSLKDLCQKLGRVGIRLDAFLVTIGGPHE